MKADNLLQQNTEFDGATAGQADDNTADTSEAPKKRGRPRGSRSKTSRESREVLAKHGPAVFERICRIALGKFVYTEPDSDGRRTKRYPTEAAETAAQKIVADRLVPQLKAIEQTGADGQPLYPQGEPPVRELGKAVLEILSSGVDGRVAIEEPGTHLARFTDPDLGRRILPGDDAPLRHGVPVGAEAGPSNMTVTELDADDDDEATAAPEPDRLHVWNGDKAVLTLTAYQRGRFRVFDTRTDELLQIKPTLDAAKDYATDLIAQGKFGVAGQVRFEPAPLPAMPGGEEVRREQRKDMPRPVQTSYRRGHARAART